MSDKVLCTCGCGRMVTRLTDNLEYTVGIEPEICGICGKPALDVAFDLNAKINICTKCLRGHTVLKKQEIEKEASTPFPVYRSRHAI